MDVIGKCCTNFENFGDILGSRGASKKMWNSCEETSKKILCIFWRNFTHRNFEQILVTFTKL